MLFEKDYKKETPEIKKQLRKYNEGKEELDIFSKKMKLPMLSPENEYSVDFWKHLSLFPNNQLIDPKFEDKNPYREKLTKFTQLIDNPKTIERGVLNFIKDQKAYFIIASLLKKYDFGHHSRFLFKEFPLGTSYAADFLIIGSGSGGYRFIFVELESVYGRVTISKGDLGDVLRKGLNQIEDWKSWLDSNFSNLREIFNKYKGSYKELPRELIEYDSSRMHYVVIGGRREYFNEKTYSIRRRLEKHSIKLIHYDALIDYSKELIDSGDY